MHRRLIALFVLLTLCHCSEPSVPPTAQAQATRQQKSASKTSNDAPPATPSPAIAHELRPIALSSGPGALHRFRIPLQHVRFSFVDLGYRTPLVEALADQTLLFNGGYWAFRGQNERVIEGLVIVNGVQHAPQNRNSSGGVIEVRDGRAQLFKSGEYSAHPGATVAVQCSPRLVAAGQVIAKLDTLRRAARTALCIGNDRSLLDVYLTDDRAHPTLSELASFLLEEGCVEALNLDGGPSTAAVAQGPEGKLRVGFGDALPYGFGVSAAAGLQTKQAVRAP